MSRPQKSRWRSWRFLLTLTAALFILLLIIAAVRTVTLDVSAELPRHSWGNESALRLDLSPQLRKTLLDNFKAAVQIPTVSYSETNISTDALIQFDLLLRRAFPRVFSSALVRHEMVGTYSHLFSVLGREAELQPYMLLAHTDVVPAREEDGWDAPPFSAQELHGFIYGRGTIDDKQCVMGILQALECLLERGYAPQRSFFIGLGHDEELHGSHGAVNIVKLLKSRGVKLLYVLDEGLTIMDGIVDGLTGPAALIGVSEKGQVTVKLSVSSAPGHSSMPPRESSIGILASAVRRLEKNRMPNLFGQGPERATFEHLAHKFGLPHRMVMSNLWLFGSLLGGILEDQPDTNAFVRTTTAVTMFNAGVKVNVMPAYSEAFVNLRVHSAQSVRQVLELVESRVSDARVKLELVEGFEPLPISSYQPHSYGFSIIKKTLMDLFPQLSVTPGICVGNTDSRHYTDLSPDIYRFAPSWYKPGDSARFHGVNERISVQNYEEMVQFYFRLIQNSDVRKLPSPRQ